MLVGSTGTGKSTLVDGMINYLLGVNFNDPYRLTLVDLEDEERVAGVNQVGRFINIIKITALY